MTISEAQSDEESDCHRRYSYNSERGGSLWALNDTETILGFCFHLYWQLMWKKKPFTCWVSSPPQGPTMPSGLHLRMMIDYSCPWVGSPCACVMPPCNKQTSSRSNPRHHASFALLERETYFS